MPLHTRMYVCVWVFAFAWELFLCSVVAVMLLLTGCSQLVVVVVLHWLWSLFTVIATSTVMANRSSVLHLISYIVCNHHLSLHICVCVCASVHGCWGCGGGDDKECGGCVQIAIRDVLDLCRNLTHFSLECNNNIKHKSYISACRLIYEHTYTSVVIVSKWRKRKSSAEDSALNAKLQEMRKLWNFEEKLLKHHFLLELLRKLPQIYILCTSMLGQRCLSGFSGSRNVHFYTHKQTQAEFHKLFTCRWHYFTYACTNTYRCMYVYTLTCVQVYMYI